MSNNKAEKDLFSTIEKDELDEKIKNRVSRPTLVGEMRKKKKKVRQRGAFDFSTELEKNWYIYALLVVSAMFTGTLGVYMGLAPKATESEIYFHTDLMHIALAFAYLVSFISVTEGTFVLGKWLYFIREDDNGKQKFSAVAMIMLSGISILGTGIAGGLVIASNISFLTKFAEVPEAAQIWVVVIIPALITMYAFLATVYHLSSDETASERIAREQGRQLDLDHRTRERAVQQIAAEELQVAELRSFVRNVEDGKITAAEALARMKAGKILQTKRIMASDVDEADFPNA